jgi:hypothetical protein
MLLKQQGLDLSAQQAKRFLDMIDEDDGHEQMTLEELVDAARRRVDKDQIPAPAFPQLALAESGGGRRRPAQALSLPLAAPAAQATASEEGGGGGDLAGRGHDGVVLAQLRPVTRAEQSSMLLVLANAQRMRRTLALVSSEARSVRRGRVVAATGESL